MIATPNTDNPVVSGLANQIAEGINKINKANEEIFFAEEKGTPLREIDAALKSEDVDPKFASLYAEYVEANNRAKELLKKARNEYRTEVLGEDADNSADDSEKEELKDELKEIRSVVVEAASFIKVFAQANNLAEVSKWVDELEIPQVARKAVSKGGGSKKPRVFVKVDGVVHDSFTLAAQELSKGSEKKIVAGDLAGAWEQALNSEEGTFTLDLDGNTHEINVTFKNKK